MKEFLKNNILKIGRKRKYGIIAAGLILMAGTLLWYKGEAKNTGVPGNASPSSFTVVIDPGHGGA